MKKHIILMTSLILAIILCGAVSAADDTNPAPAAATINEPDLVITNFDVPTNVEVGTTYPVTVTVKNNGTANAGAFNVYLWENTQLLDQKPVSSLAAGQSTNVVFNWNPTSTGTTKLQAGLNSDDLITETVLYDGGSNSIPFTYTTSTSNTQEFNGFWDFTDKTLISTVKWDEFNYADEYNVELYSGNKFASWKYLQGRMTENIWWDIGLSRNDPVYYGGFTDADLSSITKIKIYFISATAGAKTALVNKVTIRDIKNSQGYITFRFDDATASTYQNAYALMQPYGYAGSVFPIINSVGTAGYMTVDQLNTLYNNGWDVGSHTMTHSYPQTLDTAGMMAELANSKQWLLNHGYTNSANLFVAPYFAMTSAYYDLISQYYLTCGVGNFVSIPAGKGSLPLPSPNFFQATNGKIDLNSLPTDLAGNLNAVAQHGEWTIVLVHTVSTPQEIADFTNLLQLVQASGLKVRTFSQMYALENNSPSQEVMVNALNPAPTVESVDPAQGSVDVTTNKALTVTFNEAVQAGSAYDNIKVEVVNGGLVSINKLISGTQLTITPASGTWNPGTLYRIIIPVNSVQDLAGKGLASATSSDFTTATTFNLVSVDPASGATGVATNQAMTLSYNHNIKAGSMWIEFKDALGNDQAFTTSINGYMLTVTPTSPLKEGVMYTLTVHQGAVMDLSGGQGPLTTTSFTTTGSAPTIYPSPGTGSYWAPVNVVLAASEPSTIYYTLGGATPTKDSTVYTGPIYLATSRTLRFMGIDATGNPSLIGTQFYTIYALQYYKYWAKVRKYGWYKYSYKVRYKKWYRKNGKWRYYYKYKTKTKWKKGWHYVGTWKTASRWVLT